MTTGAAEMDPQLMSLLEIQDLRSKLRELEGESEMGMLEREHFHVDPAEAVRQLTEKIHELEDQLAGPIRRRYDRIVGKLDRVVVPVIGGVCYGCYTSIATATAGEHSPERHLRGCENCGRIIYILS